jgi:hypothetical protein
VFAILEQLGAEILWCWATTPHSSPRASAFPSTARFNSLRRGTSGHWFTAPPAGHAA